ncbi:unnamed protein product, partial [Rotaria socialis]
MEAAVQFELVANRLPFQICIVGIILSNLIFG